MLTKLMTVAVIITLSGCGGGEVDGVGTSTTEDAINVEYSESGKSIDVRSEKPIDNVLISGDNNIVSFFTIPKSISISGNDNTIYKPENVGVSSTGLGNTVIDTDENSVGTLQP